MSKFQFLLPQAEQIGNNIRCPECGYESDIDGWDCGGADFGCLFCNGCGAECQVGLTREEWLKQFDNGG